MVTWYLLRLMMGGVMVRVSTASLGLGDLGHLGGVLDFLVFLVADAFVFEALRFLPVILDPVVEDRAVNQQQ